MNETKIKQLEHLSKKTTTLVQDFSGLGIHLIDTIRKFAKILSDNGKKKIIISDISKLIYDKKTNDVSMMIDGKQHSLQTLSVDDWFKTALTLQQISSKYIPK